MHKIGERILVRRDGFWYPGAIHHLERGQAFVICADGSDGFFAAEQLAPWALAVGDQVLVRHEAEGALTIDVEYQPAKIVEVQADRLQVVTGNGVSGWVSLGQIRLDPPQRLLAELAAIQRTEESVPGIDTPPEENDKNTQATAAGCLLALVCLAVILGVALPVVSWRNPHTGQGLPRLVAIMVPVLAGAGVYGIISAILRLLGIPILTKRRDRSTDNDQRST